MTTIFARASKKKLRFETEKGLLSTEDLWDLPLLDPVLLCLNDMAKKYNKRVKDDGEDNFVEPAAAKATDDKLKFELVKHVIDYKVQAAAAQENRLKKQQQRELILKLIDEKQNDELKEKSAEELLAMLD